MALRIVCDHKPVEPYVVRYKYYGGDYTETFGSESDALSFAVNGDHYAEAIELQGEVLYDSEGIYGARYDDEYGGYPVVIEGQYEVVETREDRLLAA